MTDQDHPQLTIVGSLSECAEWPDPKRVRIVPEKWFDTILCCQVLVQLGENMGIVQNGMMLGTRTILAGLITILMIGHAGAESKRQPSHSQQQTPSTQTTQPSAPDQRGTDQMPLSVKIIPGERTKEQAEKEEHERREKDEKAAVDKRLADQTQRLADETDNLATYTSFLFCAALGQIALFVWQLWLIRKSFEVSQKTLILTQRPKLRVRNITTTQHWATDQRSPHFREGPLIGHFYISNVGGTPATIVESLCLVHPTKRSLPMNL